MTKRGSRLFKENHVIDYVNRRLQNFFRVEWYNELHKYTSMDLSRSFTANDQRLPDPPEAVLRRRLLNLPFRIILTGAGNVGIHPASIWQRTLPGALHTSDVHNILSEKPY
jgi:hypothetical protein